MSCRSRLSLPSTEAALTVSCGFRLCFDVPDCGFFFSKCLGVRLSPPCFMDHRCIFFSWCESGPAARALYDINK